MFSGEEGVPHRPSEVWSAVSREACPSSEDGSTESATNAKLPKSAKSRPGRDRRIAQQTHKGATGAVLLGHPQRRQKRPRAVWLPGDGEIDHAMTSTDAAAVTGVMMKHDARISPQRRQSGTDKRKEGGREVQIGDEVTEVQHKMKNSPEEIKLTIGFQAVRAMRIQKNPTPSHRPPSS